MANGYGNRHLWICSQRSKLLPLSGKVDEAAWQRLEDRMTKAIDFSRVAGEVDFAPGTVPLWCEA